MSVAIYVYAEKYSALAQETKTLRSRCSSLQQDVANAESLRYEIEEEANRYRQLHEVGHLFVSFN